MRLKWHRLRKLRSDPVFGLARLAEGVAAGAALEVDLRIMADGFAVLHDPDLSGETTGTGPIRAARQADLPALRMRDDPDAAPATLAQLTAAYAALNAGAGHLQLDFKDDPAALTEAHRIAFAAACAPVARHLVLSGEHPEGLASLVARVPGMRLGIDPMRPDSFARVATAEGALGFAREAIASAPTARIVYLEYPTIIRAPALVAHFHAAGMEVDAYTINTDHPGFEASLDALIAAGVDQITTDEPGVIAARRGLLAP